MHIIYAVTTCSDRVYRQLFEDAPRKPAFQSQKYHRLLIEGLAAGAKVDVVANPPVNREVLKKSFVRHAPGDRGRRVLPLYSRRPGTPSSRLYLWAWEPFSALRALRGRIRRWWWTA